MDIADRIAEANQRLRSAKIRVHIFRRGEKLYFRATLPSKTGEGTGRYDLSTGCSATPAGLRRAEAIAKKLGAEVACKEFSWSNWGNSPNPEKRGDWLKRFEADYFERRDRNPKSELTWKKDYLTVLKKLPAEEPTAEQLRDAVLKTRANSRSRKRAYFVINKLATFLDVEVDLDGLSGTYTMAQVQPRDIPSDAKILELRELVPSETWRWVFGVIAVYGLRPHEVFYVDLDSIRKAPGIITVSDEKRNRGLTRQVWPYLPEWWEKWELHRPKVPKVSGYDNAELGHRVTTQFRRYNLGIRPYDLRHAWAIRVMKLGLNDVLAARQMGHSTQIHTSKYLHWISEREHQEAFEKIRLNLPSSFQEP